MNKFVKFNYTIESNQVPSFPNDTVQNLRRAVLSPVVYKPIIQQTLQRINFQFHRTYSFSNLVRECNVAEGQTLLIFWGSSSSDSRVTISMSTSSCSSLHMPPNAQTASSLRDRDLRSTAQQTEIICRYSPVHLTESEEQRQLRARIADSLTFSSPASSLLQPTKRSVSILGSVCALLLNKQVLEIINICLNIQHLWDLASCDGSRWEQKQTLSLNWSTFEQGSGAKEVSESDSRSDNICRICFGGESGERLVRPCSCRGTIAAVHRSCLERWLLQAATSYCELCRHHYVVTRSHKWSWARSVVEWARSGRGAALVADAWRGIALGATSALGTARALHACDAALQAGARRGGAAALAANLFSSLLIGIIGALNGLLTTWMLLKIQEHQLSWRAWRDSTLHVHVALGDASPPLSSSLDTVVELGGTRGGASDSTTDRATNIADPFMVLPLSPDP